MNEQYILEKPTLSEAWLEIRWNLDKSNDEFPVQRDEGFPFALGLFRDLVKQKYPFSETTENSSVPLDLFPYTIRHRFRIGENQWPLLQLGPGIAAINFTKDYSWIRFKEETFFLLKSLVRAYDPSILEIINISLRYRNAEKFDYQNDDIFEFIKENLNSEIKLPNGILGSACSKEFPSSLNFKTTYDMAIPKGTGTFIIGSGFDNKNKSPIVLFQYEISSGYSDVPNIYKEDDINEWLEKAHQSIHNWYFSSISGGLRDSVGRYK